MPTNFEFTYHRKERDGGWFVGGGWKEEFNTLHGLFFVTTYSISYNKILLLLRCSWNMNSNNENIINIDLDWFECEALLAAIKVINDWFVSRTTTSEFDQHSLWFIYMKVEKNDETLDTLRHTFSIWNQFLLFTFFWVGYSFIHLFQLVTLNMNWV